MKKVIRLQRLKSIFLLMYARSFDFSSGSLPPLNYANNYGYNSDPVGFPLALPYSPNNPVSPYLYQPRVQNFQKSPQFQSKDLYNKNTANKFNENKPFIDSFDNNSSLLNQKKSFARNIKGRLMNNQNQNVEKAKHDKVESYREQLQRQIEQTRKRKQEQKQKIEKQQLERERKFYQQFKIKAQVKQNKQDQKAGNGFVMARTLHKLKKPKIENSQNHATKPQIPTVTKLNVPKGRGRMYLNHSSLDNYDQTFPTVTKQEPQQMQQYVPDEGHQQKPKKAYNDNRLTRMEQQLIRQRSNQQQRLSKLLLFQQRVLQKINDIKVEIRNTSFDIDGDKELQRIRNSLRAKPIPFDDDLNQSMAKKSNYDINHFYSLPKRQIRTMPPSRYSVKLNDANHIQEFPQKSVKSEAHEAVNDKNFILSQNQEDNEEQDQ